MGRSGQEMHKITYANSDCGPRSRVNATNLTYIAGQTHAFNRHREQRYYGHYSLAKFLAKGTNTTITSYVVFIKIIDFS